MLLCVVRRGAEEAFNDQRGANVRVDEERFVDLVHDSQQGRRAVHFDFLQRRYDNPQRKRKVRRHEVKHEDRRLDEVCACVVCLCGVLVLPISWQE